ncbi:hypothetical protein C8F04DRAFT_952229 [Mycena alexandri]|uniref:DUF6533 domain-containing protein n=1 Tax=Mycena alexandri TaxID=1745969 RepID=A0AAD6T2T9_9AGAR|nr:hypothetical protein C8F04DRAFT_952229 [Mycena alexandri]
MCIAYSFSQYVGFAAFTILIWDHIDTFTAEVEYIWKSRKGIIAYLFLLVKPVLDATWVHGQPLRYTVYAPCLSSSLTPSPLSILVARMERPGICKHFIRFEGAMTVIGIHVVAIMMLLRIRALYSTQRIVVGCVFLLFMIMFVVNAWLLTRGQPVAHNPLSGVRACTMIFPPSFVIASSSAWLPLLYDSVVLVLTLLKTVPLIGKRKGTIMVKRLLEDGLIYYTAIFSVTLVLTVMIVSAPPG